MRLGFHFLSRALKEPGFWPPLKGLFVIGAISWLPSQAIGWVVRLTYPGPAGRDAFATYFSAMVTICWAPLFETCLMALLFRLLNLIPTSADTRAFISALLWTIPHARGPTWGLHATWSFYIFSLAYQALAKISERHAILGTAIIHGLYNAFSGFLYLLINRIVT